MNQLTLANTFNMKSQVKLSRLGVKTTAKLLQFKGLSSLDEYSKQQKKDFMLEYNEAIDRDRKKIKKKKKADTVELYPEIAPLSDQQDNVRRNSLEQLGLAVELELDLRNINGPFYLTLKSLIANVQHTFEFNHLSHFIRWHQKLVEAPRELDSQGTIPEMREKNLFADGAIIKEIQPIRGSCNSNATCEQVKKSSFYVYEVTNVKSKNNNCLFKSLEHISQQVLDIKQLRKHLELPTGAILINDAYRVIRYLNLDITIIDLKTADSLIVDGSVKYILYDDNHFTAVNTITAVLRKDIKSKRGLMTFDLEARPTDEYNIVKKTNTKLFILKDTLTSVYYRPYKQTDIIQKMLVTNEKVSSVRQFVNFLNDEAKSKRCYNVIAHNGGNFDFYFLISCLTKQELLDSQIFLRGMTIIGINYRGNLFKDSYCFITSALKDISKSFKISEGKIDSCVYQGKVLTSMELCMYKNELSFNEFMLLEQNEPEYWKLYEKYCMYDSIAIFQIWEQFTECVNSLISKISPHLLIMCPLMGSMTIGSHAKKILKELNSFKGQQTSYKNELDKFLQKEGEDGSMSIDFEKYEFLCKFKRGGISHCNQAGCHMSGITGVDIASQYPASLIYSKIPTGVSNWLNPDAIFSKRLYGFYYITDLVFESTLTLRPVAVDILKQSLNWASKDMNELYSDGYTIQYLIDNFGLKKFKIVKALVSKKEVSSDRIFGRLINNFYNEKKRQDALKEEDSLEYNDSQRTSIKLYLNALTGKLVEDPSIHFSLELTPNLDEANLKFNGLGARKCSNGRYNDWLVAGIMVYSYSKRLLFEYIKCLPQNSKDVIHIETDGIYFSTRHLQQFQSNLQNYQGDFPCMLGSDLGNLKIEKSTQEGQVAYFLGKKFYCITTDTFDIMRIKGIPQKSIESDGSSRQVVNRKLYEKIYAGEKVEARFNTLKKSLWADKSNISVCPMLRTVKPNSVYQLYE